MQSQSEESRKGAVKLRLVEAVEANLGDGAVVNPKPTTRDGFPNSIQHRFQLGV